jgi:hypothetical protein
MFEYEKDIISPKKFSLWIGKTDKSRDEWWSYFKGSDESDPSSPILQSLDTLGIDFDFWGSHLTAGMKPTPIPEVLKELPHSKDSEPLILEKCKSIGLEEANALFYYLGAIFKGDESILYNDLHFIGVFDSYLNDMRWNGKKWVAIKKAKSGASAT